VPFQIFINVWSFPHATHINTVQDDLIGNSTQGSGKPMSKIAALAKSRALQRSQQEEQNGKITSVSILDKLKTNNGTNGKGSLGSLSSLNSKTTGLSGLKGLGTKTTTTSLKRPNPFEKKQLKSEESTTSQKQPKAASVEKVSKPIIKEYDLSFNESPYISNPPHQIFQNDPLELSRKRRKLIDLKLTNVYMPANYISQAQQNFNKSSPDDIVKAAASQSKAKPTSKPEEVKPVAEKLSNLHITPTNSAKFDKDLSSRIASKPSASLVIIGHVDAGKSTLTGRLLLDYNVISTQQYQKLKREAAKQNKASFSLAWLMDSTPEERDRGVTIDSCASAFETDSYVFNIIDSPGHRDFIPNMISGVSSTDVALLVVDASTDAFESGFTLDGQTKEHTILVKSLGVEKLIVVVNKMDNVDWSSDRFQEIQSQLHLFFKSLGYHENNVSYVPVSAFSGLNVSHGPKTDEEKRKLNWFKDGSVIDALERVAKTVAVKDTNGKFIFSINDVIVSASGLEISGRIHSGSITLQQQIFIAPSNQTSLVDTIILNEKKVNVAIAGDFVTLKVKNIPVPPEVQKGDLITLEPLSIAHKLTLRLILFDLKRPILIGTPLVIFRGDSQLVASISKIISILDKVTGEPVPKKAPRHLKSSQVALVEVEFGDSRGLPGLLYKDDKILGRVVLRKDGETIGAGVVEDFQN
jgi:elongation factor 1 alpha-like protein